MSSLFALITFYIFSWAQMSRVRFIPTSFALLLNCSSQSTMWWLGCSCYWVAPCMSASCWFNLVKSCSVLSWATLLKHVSFCSWTASHCLIIVLAFSSVSSASMHNCSGLKSPPLVYHISFLSPPYWQFSTRWYSVVMYCSTDSPGSWLRQLNFARSRMTFLRTLKKPFNFSRTLLYFALSSSLILVELKTSSASSPKQYRRVLTCLALKSWIRCYTTLLKAIWANHLVYWS